ncbi:C-type lectin mannose-binding isoform-like [Mytilus trossulus]|uniref:C-type lectin mannose-binding isoform-like n=1 Tax=Mytilus trossulus TaxID=6551 RepID=UPI003006B741
MTATTQYLIMVRAIDTKLTRPCTAYQGRCAKLKDSNCESTFGSGWSEKGSCCRKRTCCVFQCEDIPTNSLANGTVIVAERNVGSTAKFTCDAGLFLAGRQNITCTTSGWDGNIPQCTNISCPETVAFFNGSKYIFKCNGGNWSNSEANCNVLGGHLTSVDTGDEYAFLMDVIALMIQHIEQILYGFFWIWEPFNYSDWYPGSPQQPDNNNTQNMPGAYCTLLFPPSPLPSSKWNYHPCSAQSRSVCEIRLT